MNFVDIVLFLARLALNVFVNLLAHTILVEKHAYFSIHTAMVTLFIVMEILMNCVVKLCRSRLMNVIPTIYQAPWFLRLNKAYRVLSKSYMHKYKKLYIFNWKKGL